jgi:predicted metallopeptidase
MQSPRHGRFRRDRAHRDGFDFTFHVRRLCGDMVRRLPELRHIELSRVAISYAQTRKAVEHGLYASLTPLRFPGGTRQAVRRGRRWTVQRVVDTSGQEMLYLLSFYLPRFLDQSFRHKLTTVVHELWHISPRFDGDLRRFAGRCYAHSSSQKRYDAKVEQLVDRWLALEPPAAIYNFLRYDFRELVRHYGRVYGVKIPAPKLIPVE